jgi:ATP-independent RNA helicase DbpA
MEKILKDVPKTRQTVFFSATFPKSIETLSRTYQRSPVSVKIDDPEQARVEIRQVYYEVEPQAKLQALLWLLQQNEADSAIVFCNLKATVSELAEALQRASVSCACLHGDLEQSARDKVMAKFRNQSTRVLIATDVAARGIDIPNLDVVFNFDIPKPDVYIHRIGRTGRAGKKGLAISMVTSQQSRRIPNIEKVTGHKMLKREIASLPNLETARVNQTAKMETLYISGGRKDKVRPGDILGALTGDAGRIQGSDIGKIEIHDRFSYVAVSRHLADLVIDRLRNGRIKGRKFRIEKVR